MIVGWSFAAALVIQFTDALDDASPTTRVASSLARASSAPRRT
jgi:hypothetical protein